MAEQEPQQDEAKDPWWSTLWERFEQWANELGQPWEQTRKRARVADEKKARASKSRVGRGEAPEVRERLYSTLVELEERHGPTRTGLLVMGVEEWAKIGRHLAAIDPGLFLRLLAAARDRLQQAERDLESPFFAIKPDERPPQR